MLTSGIKVFVHHLVKKKLLTFFNMLGLSVGLIGLVTYAAEQRIKEIGIRKTVGAGVLQIILLFNTDFSKLALVANVIAWPVGYVALQRWLESFAYRIDLTPLVFIGSGLIVLCVTLVTVGSTAAKAASAKPVLALRYE